MALLSYRRPRFPPPIIQHAIWLYLRFTLSYRDVEDLLAERGLDLSYETVRRWVLKFGPAIARRLRPLGYGVPPYQFVLVSKRNTPGVWLRAWRARLLGTSSVVLRRGRSGASDMAAGRLA